MLILSIISLFKNSIYNYFNKQNNKKSSNILHDLIIDKTKEVVVKPKQKTGNLTFDLKFIFFLF